MFAKLQTDFHLPIQNQTANAQQKKYLFYKQAIYPVKVNDSKMLMMRLITENGVCTLLQVSIMYSKKYHYAKENLHRVLNQS